MKIARKEAEWKESRKERAKVKRLMRKVPVLTERQQKQQQQRDSYKYQDTEY